MGSKVQGSNEVSGVSPAVSLKNGHFNLKRNPEKANIE
jgi:hypothetical protein